MKQTLVCRLFHDKKSFNVTKADGKLYKITYCLKCDYESEKEVK